MPSRVAILGCGPAGLAAAEAAVNCGHKVAIFSNTDRPSTQYGCQYLHAPIPGHESVAHTTVSYHLNGTPDQYRLKVYGSKWQGRVSPEDFIGDHDAWDIRATYQSMWANLHGINQVVFVRIPAIQDGNIPDEILHYRPNFMISTIPAPALCRIPEHDFIFHTIYANGSVKPNTGIEDEIICDGTPEHEWYRIATVFGFRTTEWSHRPIDGASVAAVAKPLKTNCDCYPNIYRVGRYGKWEKGYLVHQVYPEVMEILK